MSQNEIDIIEEYNTEKAKVKLFKKINQRHKEEAFMHPGAKPKANLNTSPDVKIFKDSLSSMKIVEETSSVVRYSNMPEIEFKSLIKIPSTKVFKRNKLMKFKAKLAASTAEKMDASDCGLLNIEFKEIGT